jgi:hypothetical protein
MCDELGNLKQPPGRPARVFRKAAVSDAGVIAGAGLAAGCGGSSGGPGVASAGASTGAAKSASGGSSKGSALAFAQWMRSHGIKDFPDPSSNGGGLALKAQPGSDLDRNNSRFQSANKACRGDLPGGGAGAPQMSANGGGAK